MSVYIVLRDSSDSSTFKSKKEVNKEGGVCIILVLYIGCVWI